MEVQRGEETRQDLKTGSPDAVLSPPIAAVTFKLCLFRQGRECGKGAPHHVMNSFIGAGKDPS